MSILIGFPILNANLPCSLYVQSCLSHLDGKPFVVTSLLVKLRGLYKVHVFDVINLVL